MSIYRRIAFWVFAPLLFLAGAIVVSLLAGLIFSEPEVVTLASFAGGLLWGPIAVSLGVLVHDRLEG